jgi:5-methylcytosine-specific restriction endonuclease McrA
LIKDCAETKTCIKCGAEFSKINCPECSKIYSAKYVKENKEKVRISAAKRYVENKEKIRDAVAIRYLKNPQKFKDRSSKWAKENPDKRRATKTEWRRKNPESAIKRTNRWRENNPDRVIINNQNRRARKKESNGILSHGLAEKLFKLQKGKCPCCLHALGSDYHMDHIVPLSLGGSNTDDNIQLLRAVCNMRKHTDHPIDFMRKSGFLL